MKAKSIGIPRNLRLAPIIGPYSSGSSRGSLRNVGAEAGDELEEGGEVPSGSGSSWFALLLYAPARSQARSRRVLFMVVRISLFLHLFGCLENGRK